MINLALVFALISSVIIVALASTTYYLLYKKKDNSFNWKITIPEEAFLWTINIKADTKSVMSLRILIAVLITFLTALYGAFGFFSSALVLIFIYFAYYPLELLKDYVRINDYEYNFVTSLRNYLKYNNTGRYNEDLNSGIAEYSHVFNDTGLQTWIKNKNRSPEGTQGKIDIYEALTDLNYDSADLYLESQSNNEKKQVKRINKFVQKIHLNQVLLALMAGFVMCIVMIIMPLDFFFVSIMSITVSVLYFIVVILMTRTMMKRSKEI